MKPLPANLPPLPDDFKRFEYWGIGPLKSPMPNNEESEDIAKLEEGEWLTGYVGDSERSHYALRVGSKIWKLNQRGHRPASTKEWFQSRAHLEEGLEIGAGRLPDPVAQPTTVLGWLETMPEPWRGQAIANCEEKHHHKPCSSIEYALRPHRWMRFPEGGHYWDSVQLHFSHGTPLPSPTTAANYVAPVEPKDRPLVSLEKKYRYRNGKAARVLCIDAPGESPVISMMECGGILYHNAEGSYYNSESKSSCDLVEVRPEPREMTLYRYGGGWTTIQASHTDECIRVREVAD